jgi:hypothetical protein
MLADLSDSLPPTQEITQKVENDGILISNELFFLKFRFFSGGSLLNTHQFLHFLDKYLG